MNLACELRKPHITDLTWKLYDLGHQGTIIHEHNGAVWVIVSPDTENPIKGEGTSLFGAYSQAYQIAIARAKQPLKKEGADLILQEAK